ncbi:hypothetical protein [Actinomadura rudentiformis]|uniref:Uncharacterized protein n=1 Tax=Actinomadura rudentiformis TaxID=359158 RepID=A0A6H9YL36_9ACTN|nr:hypothetical protein [Actinomadura rudentiformis]KAB2337890.1 hypothetical protein F8566_49280 [Actinomadura rudentiformis]
MSSLYERRCRTLLRAYPPSYRKARAEELIGTLLDAAEPGRDIPSLGVSWDVVRGGLITRWRARPPLHHWLAYRLIDKRVPYRYRMWVRDDVLGRWHFARSFASGFAYSWLFMLATWTVMSLITGDSPLPLPLPYGDGWWLLIGLCAVLLFVVAPLLERRTRRRILHKHEFLPDGTPCEESQPHADEA